MKNNNNRGRVRNFRARVRQSKPVLPPLMASLLALWLGTAAVASDGVNGDLDGDGLTNGQENNTYFTDPNDGDTDDDGLNDGDEVLVRLTDPHKADTDDDGFNDYAEARIFLTNPLVADANNDGDFWPDSLDQDDDNDGVVDADDTFPLDAAEFADHDSDGVGDNADTDDDNDGVPDDTDALPFDGSDYLDFDVDGVGDSVDVDDDNDGFVDVYDTFPQDAAEQLDTDGDGTGNNADSDDDNDGVADGDDPDPLDPSVTSNTPPDADGDGISDFAEINVYGTDPHMADTDGDTLTDHDEVFVSHSSPLLADGDGDGLADPDELALGADPSNPDTDGDGLIDGDEAAYFGTSPLLSDTDGDGAGDGADVFPLDATEVSDADLDGTGDQADTDDDNDGVTDANDLYPFDAAESADSDADGIGNNADPDDDNDGLSDADELATHHTDPLRADSDGDGMPDKWELTSALNPLANDAADDADLDGMSNLQEYSYSFNPQNKADALQDWDGDGLKNVMEIRLLASNPKVPDGVSQAVTSTTNVQAFDGGWYASNEAHNPVNTNYIVGYSGSQENRNFFAFHMPTAIGSLSAARLEIDMGSSSHLLPDGGENYRIYDVTTPVSTLVTGGTTSPFVDLGSGAVFGEKWVSASGKVVVDLNASALAAISASAGKDFAVGGAITTIVGTSKQYLWGYSSSVSSYAKIVLVGATNDADGDGMLDLFETKFGLNNTSAADAPLDADGDGLTNLQEYQNNSNPLLADTDGDGLTDADEVARGLNALVNLGDSDADGLLDEWELKYFANLSFSAAGDNDADGLSNAAEFTARTSPLLADQDADGLNDGAEVAAGTDPAKADSDADGLSDGQEVNTYRTNPLVVDTDGDGLGDKQEVASGSNPLLADTDGDNLGDSAESVWGTNPLVTDTDGDGLSDHFEVVEGYSPTRADTDGDGWSDGYERNTAGTNPKVADTDGDGANDKLDAFPLDAAEKIDTDGDAVGNNADLDDDNDGVTDSSDAFPLNAGESADTDGDGAGNNADNDDDNDGLVDVAEVTAGTNALLADTDGDSMFDGWEVQYGLNPLLNSDGAGDLDDDALTNMEEYLLGSNPTLASDAKNDKDGDGLSNVMELRLLGTDPQLSNGTGGVGGVLQVRKVAMLSNATFTDTTQDDVALNASLVRLGHTVTLFSDVSAAGLSAALYQKDALVIPELEKTSSLFPALTTDARNVIKNFVSGGGLLLVNGATTTYETDLINGLYGYAIVSGSSSATSLNVGVVAGSVFSDAPASLTAGAFEVSTTSLPAAALTPYVNTTSGVTAVYVIQQGAGHVGSWSKNWASGANASWENVLHRMVNLRKTSDLDSDGIHDVYEDRFGLNKASAADAALDSDSDGLSNLQEFQNSTNPLVTDTDGDAIADKLEIEQQLNPLLNRDSDADTLNDQWEKLYFAGLAQLAAGDPDRDRVTNSQEMQVGGNPNDVDTDDDNLGDYYEFAHSMNLRSEDTDGDGLLDASEVQIYGTDPKSKSSDADTLSDYQETMIYFTNPLLADSDADGLSDSDEVALGTNPVKADTDGDGLNDYAESVAGTDPRNADSDGDSVSDRIEQLNGLDPLVADSDADGLDDGAEFYLYGTNPLAADTDGDTVNDGVEVAQSRDPLVQEDGDGDGLADFRDNCPAHANADQLDNDVDAQGDACDADDDNDGMADGADSLPFVAGTYPGAPDASFSGDGLLVASVNGKPAQLRAALALPDGKLVAAGYVETAAGNRDVLLARYNVDGSLDATFGVAGVVVRALSVSNDEVHAVAVQPDGKLLVAGSVCNWISGGTCLDYNSVLLRFHADGTPDTGFATNGLLSVDTDVMAYVEQLTAVVVQPDGRIAAAGYSCVNWNGSSCLNYGALVLRVNSDGSLDGSFASGGIRVDAMSALHDQLYGLALQADGKLVAAGRTCAWVSGNSCYDENSLLVRYSVDGSIDTTFAGGALSLDTGAAAWKEQLNAVAVQPDGKLLAAGYRCVSGGAAVCSDTDAMLIRLNADGSYDAGFATGGIAGLAMGSGSDAFQALYLYSDGRVAAAGYAPRSGQGNDFALARFNAGGALDTSLGGGVLYASPGTGDDRAFALVAQSTETLTLVGSSSLAGVNATALVRYRSEADTDGDGVPDRIDTLPLDALETVDTDGDSIGNNADLDDDNDGFLDTHEAGMGSNPRDALSVPVGSAVIYPLNGLYRGSSVNEAIHP